jgi:hypothetical protein
MENQHEIIGHAEPEIPAPADGKRKVDYDRILKELALAKAYIIAHNEDPKTVLKKFCDGKDVDYVRMINHTYQLKKQTHNVALKAIEDKIVEFTAKKNKKEGVPPPAAEPAPKKETKEMECQTDDTEDEAEDVCPGFKPAEYTSARAYINKLRTSQYNTLIALQKKYNSLMDVLEELDIMDQVNDGEEQFEKNEIIWVKPKEITPLETWNQVAEDVKKLDKLHIAKQKNEPK